MNIIVIGAGISGLCIAANLAARGASVTLLDQGDIPHNRAASFDQHRIIRHMYPASDAYGRLVDRAFTAWDGLWSRLGRMHLAETGVLAISTEAGDWSDQGRAALTRIGIPYETLSAADLRQRLPHLRFSDRATGILTARGGALFADRICTDLARWLRRNAVDLLPHHKVTGIDAARGRVTVESGEIFIADKVVICCGAWIGRLLPDFARDLVTYRQAVLYLTPPAPWADAWARSPVIVDFGGSSGAYALPPVQGSDLKIAVPAHRRPGDPDHDASLCFDEAETILSYVRDNLIDLESYRQLYLKTCFYTMAPQDRFRLQQLDRVIAFSGCSGHGFKFGALIGEMLAEAVLEKADPNQTARILGGY